ncbi:MAG: hypothetical protein ACRDVM_07640 [Acidimicrobiia bacterium]
MPLLRILLLHPQAYRRVGWPAAVASVVAPYLLTATRVVILEAGAQASDAARLVVTGVVRWGIVAFFVWLLGVRLRGLPATPTSVVQKTGLAHTPLLVLAVFPTLGGLALGTIWFVTALAAATTSALATTHTNGWKIGGLALSGLFIVVALSPVDLLGIPPSP